MKHHIEQVNRDFILLIEGSDCYAVTINGNTMQVKGRAASQLLEWRLAETANLRQVVERISPDFFAAVQRLFHDTVDQGEKVADWQSRIGALASAYHSVASQVLYIKDPPETVRVALPRPRIVPCPRSSFVYDRAIKLSYPEGFRDMSFAAVMADRRSYRRYKEQPVSLKAFSILVLRTFGILGEVDPGFGNILPYKTFVAAGSRHEQWPIIIVYNVDGIDPGVYAFDDSSSQLIPTTLTITRDSLDSLSAAQGFAKTCAFCVLLVSDMDELTWKYRTPAIYRLAWANAGAVLQDISLISTSVGLGGVPTGAIVERRIREKFDLLPQEIPTFLYFGGYPDGPPTVARLRI